MPTSTTSGRQVPTRRRARFAALAAASAIAIAGCSSDGDDAHTALSKTDFIAQADALCTDATAKMDAVPLPNGDPSSGTLSDEDLALTSSALRALDAIETTLQADLAALVPPTDFAERWKDSMTGLAKRLVAGEKAADAADAGNQPGLVAAFGEYDAAGDSSRGPLAGYGFTVCAG